MKPTKPYKDYKPLVSICCIVYNQINFLEECLKGFEMQQVNFNIEIVIHDDFSTDGSRQRLLEYQEKSKFPVHLILPEENTYSKGEKIFLKTFKKATGKYIAMCEGDDYWTDPLKLQKQVDFLATNETFSGCFHNVYFKNEINGENKMWRDYDKNKTVYNAEDTIRKLSLFHTSSYMFRNQIKEFPYWFDKIFSGDMALLALISGYGDLKLLDDVMSVYRKNYGGVTSNEKVLTFHKQRIVLNTYLNEFFSYKFNEKAQKIIKYHKKEVSNYRKHIIKSKLARLLKKN